MSKDLFGIDEPDDLELPPYVIVQLIPAGGWQAAMEKDGSVTCRPLACFALVELQPDEPAAPPARVIRPMIGMEDGQIDDVDLFDGFLCLLPPTQGRALDDVPDEYAGLVKAARQRRQAAGH